MPGFKIVGMHLEKHWWQILAWYAWIELNTERMKSLLVSNAFE